ncbi:MULTISPECIES: hypothetical protein [unclassified Micromonospora]|uniref:hypothetical protein n=1 Tax=unclassified Micromonospora TaxID=2617518 RepID=UPI00332CA99C
MADAVAPAQRNRHPSVTPPPVTDAVTPDGVTVTGGTDLHHDLTHLPGDVRRAVTDDTAAILREVWQTFPKNMPILSDPEEETDER